MDPIKELEARLKEMLKSRKAFSKHVDRAAFKEYISLLIAETRSVIEALTEITSPTMGKAIKTALADSKSSSGITAYNDYVKQLKKASNKSAARMEESVPFSSLVEALKRRLVVLTELESQVDDLFKHNTINLFNGRLSHIVVIGLVAQSKMICKFSKFLLSAVVSSITNQRDVAKYRYEWMSNYLEPTAEVVAKSISSKNGYDFEAIIKDMQTKAVDVTLIDDFNKVTVGMINKSQVSSDAKSIIKHGVQSLGLFRWIGEILATRKQNKIEEKRREIEWMRAHVELLKMKLEEVDEDSPEYQRLVKIIARYEEMITKADKKAKKEEQL